jgi:hypothetical protein
MSSVHNCFLLLLLLLLLSAQLPAAGVSAQCWWTFILVTVVATLFLEPFNLAWSEYPGL